MHFPLPHLSILKSTLYRCFIYKYDNHPNNFSRNISSTTWWRISFTWVVYFYSAPLELIFESCMGGQTSYFHAIISNNSFNLKFNTSLSQDIIPGIQTPVPFKSPSTLSPTLYWIAVVFRMGWERVSARQRKRGNDRHKVR